MKEDETNGKYVINGANINRSKRLTTEAQGTVFLGGRYVLRRQRNIRTDFEEVRC
jgi:hypothetical protein